MQIRYGDCLALLPTLDPNSIDAIVTDPPYHLTSIAKRFSNPNAKPAKLGPHQRTSSGFMGKAWDHDIAFHPDVWRECLRVLKPGGHMAAFGGSRTHHRVWVAVEDAGFELRDTCMWVYGSGFPKSLDVSKAIDRKLGAEREVIGSYQVSRDISGGSWADLHGMPNHATTCAITAPATPEAAQWQGFGTALKPSHEPILIARKPLEGTVAENVLRHGVGGINIDATRVPLNGDYKCRANGRPSQTGLDDHYDPANANQSDTLGRWPANIIHDGSDEVLASFPQSSSGSAARFFYCAKASRAERDMGLDDLPETQFDQWTADGQPHGCPHRDGKPSTRRNIHPTVKPLSLMRYLCRLITPPNGTILDPFAGSGSTGVAAVQEGFQFIGIELSDEYAAIAERRIAAAL